MGHRPSIASSIATRLLGIFAVLVVLGGAGCSEGEGAAGNVPNTTAQPPPSVAQAAAAEIDEVLIRTNLEHLTGVSPAPLESGTTTIPDRGSEVGRRAAAEYMQESFEDMGIPARIIEFDSDKGRGFNVEATLEGTGGEKHLWVTAHLDSFFNAGAEDDASGLVSLLSTAKALKQLNPEHTVHFVAYDLEEVGLVGSTIYVGSVVSAIQQEEGDAAILGNIHSDMIGYDKDAQESEFDAVMGTCSRAGPIDEAITSASEEIDSPIELREECLGRSDHQHFWDAGLPAVVMTDGATFDGYPWYHDPADTIDKLNFPYLRDMIELNAATTAVLATSES